jgi:sec-independent protein translocase protein TatA
VGLLSPTKLILIVLLLLIVFGAGRVSALGRGLGEGIRNFKRGLRGDDKPPPKGPGSGDRSE